MSSSLDGRITTAPDRNVTEWTAVGIDGDAHEVTNQLYDELECDGLISAVKHKWYMGSIGLNLRNHYMNQRIQKHISYLMAR